MKKYFLKLTALVLFIGSLVSCSEDRVFYDGTNGPTLAKFTSTNGSFGIFPEPTTQNVDSIHVQVSTRSNSVRNLKARIDTVSSSPNIKNFIEIDSVASIVPAGSYDGHIILRWKKNYSDIDFNTHLTVVLNLKDSAGISAEKNSSFVVDVYKSCNFNPQLSLLYNAQVTVNPFGQSVASNGPPYSPIVTQKNPNKLNELTFNTLWGPGFVENFTGNQGHYVNQFLAPGKILVNDNLSLTITPSPDPDYTAPNGSHTYIDPKLSTGTYDACNNVFVYTLTQTLFGPSAANTVTVILTPQ